MSSRPSISDADEALQTPLPALDSLRLHELSVEAKRRDVLDDEDEDDEDDAAPRPPKKKAVPPAPVPVLPLDPAVPPDPNPVPAKPLIVVDDDDDEEMAPAVGPSAAPAVGQEELVNKQEHAIAIGGDGEIILCKYTGRVVDGRVDTSDGSFGVATSLSDYDHRYDPIDHTNRLTLTFEIYDILFKSSGPHFHLPNPRLLIEGQFRAGVFVEGKCVVTAVSAQPWEGRYFEIKYRDGQFSNAQFVDLQKFSTSPLHFPDAKGTRARVVPSNPFTFSQNRVSARGLVKFVVEDVDVDDDELSENYDELTTPRPVYEFVLSLVDGQTAAEDMEMSALEKHLISGPLLNIDAGRDSALIVRAESFLTKPLERNSREHSFARAVLPAYDKNWDVSLSQQLNPINVKYKLEVKKSRDDPVHDREAYLTVEKSRIGDPGTYRVYRGRHRRDESGRIEYSSGWRFVGACARGVRNGPGQLTSPDGFTWYGRWQEGKRTNDLGKLVLPNGDVHRGAWPANEPFRGSTEVERRAARGRTSLLTLKGLTFHYPFTNIESILVEKPGYDSIVSVNGEIVLRKASPLTIQSVKTLFASTNPAKLGVGRDSGKYLGPDLTKRYHQIVPIEVFDVDYSKNNLQRRWERSQSNHYNRMAYCITKKNADVAALQKKRRADAASGRFEEAPDMRDADDDDVMYVKTRLDRLPGLASQGVLLEENINEKFLLHGTVAEAVLPMLLEGPNNNYSSGGAFGKAVYFSEDAGKSDQYCRARPDGPDRGRDGFLKKMLGIEPKQYEDAVLSYDGKVQDVFYMFVVRVALGCPAHVTAEDFWQNRSGKPGTPAHNQRLFFEPQEMGSQPGFQFAGYQTATKLDRQFQSVVVDEWAQNAQNAMRYREFMVYDGVVAKITHLVAYKRVAKWPAGVPNRTFSGAIWQPDEDDFDDDPLLAYVDPLNLTDWRIPKVDPKDFDDQLDFNDVLKRMQEDDKDFPGPEAEVLQADAADAAAPTSAATVPGTSGRDRGTLILRSQVKKANRGSFTGTWEMEARDADDNDRTILVLVLLKGDGYKRWLRASTLDHVIFPRELACLEGLKDSALPTDEDILLKKAFGNRFWSWNDLMPYAKTWGNNKRTRRFSKFVPETSLENLLAVDLAVRAFDFDTNQDTELIRDKEVIEAVAVAFNRNTIFGSDFRNAKYTLDKSYNEVPKRIVDEYIKVCGALKNFYLEYAKQGVRLDDETTVEEIRAVTF